MALSFMMFFEGASRPLDYEELHPEVAGLLGFYFLLKIWLTDQMGVSEKWMVYELKAEQLSLFSSNSVVYGPCRRPPTQAPSVAGQALLPGH